VGAVLFNLVHGVSAYIMWFGSSTLLQCLSPSITTVVVDQQTIASTEKVRNLSVDFDSEMNKRALIAKTAQTCFYHLRRLHQIRRLLERDVACTVVTALALSRIDYCNAVLSGLPQSTIAPLQRVPNAAARVVCGLRPRDHVDH